MNDKNCILIAAILMIAVMAAPAMAANEPSYVSKYVPIVPDTGDGCGMLYVSLYCHNGIFSNSFIIQRVDPTGISGYVSGNTVTKEFAALFPALGNNETYDMPLVGTWDDRFAPGTYLLTLPDGTGGQPEYAIVTVAEHYPSSVLFRGHAISGGGEPAPRLISIISANYGKAETHEEYKYMISPAVAAYYTVVEVGDHHGNCEETNGHDYDFMVGNQKYEKRSGDDQYTYHAAVAEVDSDWVTSIPAGKHQIAERTVIDGVMADVTPFFQTVLHDVTTSVTVTDPAGADYAWLHAIQHVQAGFVDPAPGIAKGIVITYTINGGAVKTLVIPNVYASSTKYTASATSGTITL
jgi:hypothetical protein